MNNLLLLSIFALLVSLLQASGQTHEMGIAANACEENVAAMTVTQSDGNTDALHCTGNSPPPPAPDGSLHQHESARFSMQRLLINKLTIRAPPQLAS